jgi:hypothetical protein
VRHSVGEYTEEEWRRVSDQSRREIEQLRAQLRSIGAEITRLTQVQSLISQPRAASATPAPAAPAPRAAPRPEAVEPFVTHVADPMADPAAPPPRVPKAAPPQPEPATAVDELTFLKSVSDEEPRSAPRRSSDPVAGVSTATAPPRVPEVQTATSPSPGKAAAAVAKTLKCGDCGTLNRPTEWYCERCGAELAGV